MKIHTMWAIRDGEDSPELVIAWDGLAVAHDPDGWNQACLDGQAEIGFELDAWRVIEVEISEIMILEAFRPTVIVVVVPEVVPLLPPDILDPPLAVAGRFS